MENFYLLTGAPGGPGNPGGPSSPNQAEQSLELVLFITKKY